jgi:hypothetical protein
MIKTNTYIVCNSSLVMKLKSIPHFNMNLGQSLIDKKMNFNPADITIQKHYLFHDEIINLVGFIGSLTVYTKSDSLMDRIYLYNEKETFDYTLDANMSLYDNINLALGLFFDKLGIKSNVVTKPEEPIAEPVYVKPNKKMSEMTEAERILYARNLK